MCSVNFLMLLRFIIMCNVKPLYKKLLVILMNEVLSNKNYFKSIRSQTVIVCTCELRTYLNLYLVRTIQVDLNDMTTVYALQLTS